MAAVRATAVHQHAVQLVLVALARVRVLGQVLAVPHVQVQRLLKLVPVVDLRNALPGLDRVGFSFPKELAEAQSHMLLAVLPVEWESTWRTVARELLVVLCDKQRSSMIKAELNLHLDCTWQCGAHLDTDIALEVVLKALQVQLQHRREVVEQVADLGVLHQRMPLCLSSVNPQRCDLQSPPSLLDDDQTSRRQRVQALTPAVTKLQPQSDAFPESGIQMTTTTSFQDLPHTHTRHTPQLCAVIPPAWPSALY